MSQAMFSPLRGDEEKIRLQEKFKILDEEEKYEQCLAKPPWRTTSRKLLESPFSPEQAKLQTSRAGKRSGREKVSLVITSSSGKKQKASLRRNILPKTTSAADDDANINIGETKLVGNNPTSPAIQQTSSSSSAESGPEEAKPRMVIQTGLTSDSESDTPDDDKTGRKSDGFSEGDLEKPNFNHLADGEKKPLVLSNRGDVPIIQVPATINQYLRDYQRDGVEFMYKHFRMGQGAILADDMGLGKTVQVIALIAALLRKTGTKVDLMRQRADFIRKMSDSKAFEEDCLENSKRPFLIIGPASVLYNWVDELETWGHFTIGKFHKHHKSTTLNQLERNKLDVVVTTFETCRDNIDSLNQFQWEAVFADEAQKIKGLKAEVSLAIRKLHCKKRFGLTGTPVQNNLLELWAILDWAKPGCLGDVITFRNKIQRKIEVGQKLDATKRELAEGRKAKETLGKFRKQFMLRRTKKLIQDQLPNKDESVVYCKPSDLQINVYKTILEQPDMSLILTQNDPCSCDSGKPRGKCCFRKTEDGRYVYSLTFTYMQLLLKVANHVALLLPERSTSGLQQRYSSAICQKVFERHPQFALQTREAAFRTLSDPKYCGKMKLLEGLLPVFKKQTSKVLLFSYSTQLLDILEQYVISVGYEYRRLDGKTPELKRVQLVQEFNKDPNIFLFLISTKAGGLGLNLTGANVVVIFDPNWNPTHDLQAQDRAYRIGQRRNVRVYRLICSGTIEEKIYLRQVYKQQLDNVAVGEENAVRYFHGVQGDKQNKGELWGLENLFEFRPTGQCITMDILRRNAQIESGMKAFNVEKYVPPVDEPTTEASVSTAPSSDVEQEQPVDDNEVENASEDEHGAGYVFSQVLSLYSDSEASDNQHCTAASIAVTTKRRQCIRKTRKPRIIHDFSDGDDLIEGEAEMSRISRVQSPVPSTSGISSVTSAPSRKRTIPDDVDVKRTKNRVELGVRRRGTRLKRKIVSSSSDEEVEVMEAGTKRNETLSSVTSVTDVFDKCGVVHLHANRNMIGPSRAEDHMTKCAVHDVFDLHQDTQVPAQLCDPLSTSSDDCNVTVSTRSNRKPQQTDPVEIEDRRTGRMKKTIDLDGPRSTVIDGQKVLFGQTPKAIRRQQLESLVGRQKSSGEVELAKIIVCSSSSERRKFLRDFYVGQQTSLEPFFDQMARERDETRAAILKAGTKKKTGKTKKPDQVRSRNKKPKTKRISRSRGCQYMESESDKDIPCVSAPRTKRNKDHKIRSPRKNHKSNNNIICESSDQDSSDQSYDNESRNKKKKSLTTSKSRLELKSNQRTIDSQNSEEAFDSDFLDDLLTFDDAKVIRSNKAKKSDREANSRRHTPKPDKPGTCAKLQQVRNSGIKNERTKSDKVKKSVSNISDSENDSTTAFLDNLLDFADDKKTSCCEKVQRLDDRADSHVMNDVFSDPTKWVKHKRSPRVPLRSDSVEKLEDSFSRENEEYENLFRSGKMKKIKS